MTETVVAPRIAPAVPEVVEPWRRPDHDGRWYDEAGRESGPGKAACGLPGRGTRPASNPVPAMDLPATNERAGPPVSVIIPARNAEATIAEALESVLAQDYDGPVEVIVADGSEGPATAEVVRRTAPAARLVPNPARTVPTGLNAALRMASAPIIVRCDARSVLPPGYLRRVVATLRRTGAANVGGRQMPVGMSFFTRAVATAQTMMLGTGNARYRQGGAEGPTDTVYLGAFRSDALDVVGGFNPSIPVSEDSELNWRLRRHGEVVWFDPALVVTYRPRETLRALTRQYFEYGRGRRMVLRRHPASLRLRQIAPLLLVLGMAASAGLAAVGMAGAAVAVPMLWFGTLAFGALAVGVWRREPAALILPLVLASMHLSWGAGFLMPMLRGGGGIARRSTPSSAGSVLRPDQPA